MSQTRDSVINDLFQAVERFDIETIKSLAKIDHQADKNSDGRTLISQAASNCFYHKYIDIVSYLLDEIIYPNVLQNKAINKDDQFQLGKVVLFVVYKCNDAKKLEAMVKRLFKCGALNCGEYTDELNSNVFHFIAGKGIEFKKTFELLLQHATLNQITLPAKYGILPIHFAMENSNQEFIDMLSRKEKNEKIKNSKREFINMLSRKEEKKNLYIGLFILYRSILNQNSTFPIEILVKIASFLTAGSQELFNSFFPQYEFFLKAVRVLEGYKKHNPLPLDSGFLIGAGFRSQTSVTLMKNFQDVINNRPSKKISESADQISKSVQTFLDTTPDQKTDAGKKDHYATRLLIKHSLICEKKSPFSNASAALSTITTTTTATSTIVTTTQTTTSDVSTDDNDFGFELVEKRILSGRFQANTY